MARVSDNDPIEKFRFLVSWSDGLTRAGFHDCQMPKRTTSKVPYREGTDGDITTYSAGLNAMEDVVLGRGVLSMKSVAADGSTSYPGNLDSDDFYQWILKVHNATTNKASKGTGPTGVDDYRKEITITMLDRDGKVARAWKLYNAWPTHYVPGSDLNAGEDTEKSMESLTLAYEDFAELISSDGSNTLELNVSTT